MAQTPSAAAAIHLLGRSVSRAAERAIGTVESTSVRKDGLFIHFIAGFELFLVHETCLRAVEEERDE
jgi:hypothetical protein